MGEALDAARRRYGARFAEVLAGSRVWLNGEPADPSAAIGERDEVAVLPPVSGGCAATLCPAPTPELGVDRCGIRNDLRRVQVGMGAA